MTLTIRRLCEVPEFTSLCAQWDEAAWPRSPEIEAFFEDHYPAASGNRGAELPQSWVALQDGQPVGMVSLIADDHPDFLHLGPWVAAAYVCPEARRSKAGFLLQQAIMDFVRDELHRPFVYSYTHLAAQRKGWEFIQEVQDPFDPARTVGLYRFATTTT